MLLPEEAAQRAGRSQTPTPAPSMSRLPATGILDKNTQVLLPGRDTMKILQEYGIPQVDIESMLRAGIIASPDTSKAKL